LDFVCDVVTKENTLMPIINKFDYCKPATLDEAVAAVSNGKNAALLAGGTDLIDILKMGVQQPDLVVDLKGIATLKSIGVSAGAVSIGSGATFSDLMASPVILQHCPVVAECAATVASVGVRNRATMAGNICSAVACMDSGPLLLGYDARIEITGKNGKRSVPVSEFFISNRKTSLAKGEIVTALTLPIPAQKHAGCWVKLGRYLGEDLAQVNLLVLALADKTYRISYGAVGAIPIRARRIEQLFNGRIPDAALMQQGQTLVESEIQPISDIRSSKEYRMHMAKIMLERGVHAAIERLNGGGPAFGTSVI
jgi:CO/xanthine dehydrogenase FAD-binding subunit